MTITRILVGLVGSALALGLLTACGTAEGTLEPGSPLVSTTTSHPSQPDGAWTETELAVLDAIAFDTNPKGARYEPDANRVVVTIYKLGDTYTEEDIDNLTSAGEAAVEDVEVVIELTDAEPPVEN